MEGVRSSKRGRKSRRKQCRSAEQPKTEEKSADTAKKAKRKRRRGRKKPAVQIMEAKPIEVVIEKVEVVEKVENPKSKINRSWLDFDNDEEENNVPSVEETLAEISPCIIHQETTSRQINNYSSRFFCPGEVPRTAIPEIQEDNDTLLRTKQKRDTTKRSRRKTEPFNFEKQADGDLTEMFRDFKIDNEMVSSLPDLPGGLCSFMADSTEKTSKNVDGRGIYSGSISEDGMFVRSPDFGISELSRQDSLERIFDDDYDFEQSSEDCGVNSDADCSDEEEGACDLGDLPPEPQLGNVEYKLKLVKPSKQKFEHLVTQMKWRLREGQGEALYQIGVRDCGRVHGLARGELRSSLRTLRRMAARLGASCALVARGHLPGTKRARAEVLVTKVPDDQHNIEVRVAVMGSNDAGKSTLVGVLTQGELDNGRGSARLNMFRHLHEVKTGRTSSVSHEILGFDSQGRAINYAYSELMTSEEITDRSSKLINFIDLAGHRKYLKTTVQGVTGYAPHYAMLVVSATAGMNQMSLEHLAIVVALDLPFFVVITKTDCMCFDLTMQQLRQELTTIGCRKVPLPVLTLDDVTLAASNVLSCLTVPVFPVSSVNGDGLDLLRWFLFLAPPAMSVNERDRLEQEPVVFQVDETFKLGDSNGPVVGGLLKKGILTEKTKLLIGPLDSGEFVPITVNSLHRNKAPCRVVRAGQAAALGLSSQPPGLRQGMVLIAIPDNYAPIVKTSKTSDDPRLAFLSSKSGDIFWRGDLSPKIRKKMRKKRSMKTSNLEANEKESSNVTKLTTSRYSDRYKSTTDNTTPVIPKSEISADNLSSGEDDERPPPLVKDEMVDSGKEVTEEEVSDVDILVRDNPNDPRGCFFFQATVSVLSHSAAIYPGFQSTVHIGNIRQTAVIEGILSSNSVLRSKDRASVLFRFLRHPEYVRPGARILFREALHTKGIGRVTQVFPHRGPQICCHN